MWSVVARLHPHVRGVDRRALQAVGRVLPGEHRRGGVTWTSSSASNWTTVTTRSAGTPWSRWWTTGSMSRSSAVVAVTDDAGPPQTATTHPTPATERTAGTPE